MNENTGDNANARPEPDPPRLAFVEIMGHRSMVGMVSERPFLGTLFLHVEEPVYAWKLDEQQRKYVLEPTGEIVQRRFGAGAIFAIEYCDEQTAQERRIERAGRAPACIPCKCCTDVGPDPECQICNGTGDEVPF